MQYILLHFGELSLKGKNRRNFEKQMKANLKRLLHPKSIVEQHGRMLLGFEQVNQELLDYIALIPGIRNFSVASKAENSIESMREVAAQVIREDCGNQLNRLLNKPFCVRSKRGDKQFPMKSPEINYEVGGFLKNEFQLQVNLDAPELTVHIEVTRKETYIYTKKLQGIGGLPIGSSGCGVVLFSGGIDSPVAAYAMMKRGMEVILVHFYNSQINRDFAKIKALASQLSRYQGHLRLHLIDLEEFQRHAIASTPADYRMIIYKRQMIRSAADIAHEKRAAALVTGDSLGQVASQTLTNIQAIYDASTLPLLPPLISFDKEEIIAMARRIGTYEPSIEEYCDICSFLLAKHPQTHAKQVDVQRLEALLPCTGLDFPAKELHFLAGDLLDK